MPLTKAAYRRAGVDQAAADEAVDAIVAAISQVDIRGGSRQVLPSGHFANVIGLTQDIGIALSTDGVGTKLMLAEQLGRFDTVGIDCIGMNVNDLICVGAEPIAMLDYLAVPKADPKVAEQIGQGLRRGAELAGIEIPGGELAQLGEMINGIDLVGACFGVVSLDSIVTGSAIEDGDPVIGLRSSGLHANGYTLARSALRDLELDDTRLGRPLGEILLEPTMIYVEAILDLLHSPVDVRGLAHITSKGLDNLRRLDTECGFRIDSELPTPEIFDLIQSLGNVSDKEMYEVFNMGCGFCCVVAADHEQEAISHLRTHFPEAQRIGFASAEIDFVDRS
jgi:phosphoribosylformylglycinamidine cyclo-ligase